MLPRLCRQAVLLREPAITRRRNAPAIYSPKARRSFGTGCRMTTSNMKDYYDILQVSSQAEPEVIEAAYRRLARKYHPDVNSDAAAAQRMREMNEAYEILSDPVERRAYDSERHARGQSAGPRPFSSEAAEPPPASSAQTSPVPLSRQRYRRAWLGGAGLVVGPLILFGIGLAWNGSSKVPSSPTLGAGGVLADRRTIPPPSAIVPTNMAPPVVVVTAQSKPRQHMLVHAHF